VRRQGANKAGVAVAQDAMVVAYTKYLIGKALVGKFGCYGHNFG